MAGKLPSDDTGEVGVKVAHPDRLLDSALMSAIDSTDQAAPPATRTPEEDVFTASMVDVCHVAQLQTARLDPNLEETARFRVPAREDGTASVELVMHELRREIIGNAHLTLDTKNHTLTILSAARDGAAAAANTVSHYIRLSTHTAGALVAEMVRRAGALASATASNVQNYFTAPEQPLDEEELLLALSSEHADMVRSIRETALQDLPEFLTAEEFDALKAERHLTFIRAINFQEQLLVFNAESATAPLIVVVHDRTLGTTVKYPGGAMAAMADDVGRNVVLAPSAQAAYQEAMAFTTPVSSVPLPGAVEIERIDKADVVVLPDDPSPQDLRLQVSRLLPDVSTLFETVIQHFERQHDTLTAQLVISHLAPAFISTQISQAKATIALANQAEREAGADRRTRAIAAQIGLEQIYESYDAIDYWVADLLARLLSATATLIACEEDTVRIEGIINDLKRLLYGSPETKGLRALFDQDASFTDSLALACDRLIQTEVLTGEVLNPQLSPLKVKLALYMIPGESKQFSATATWMLQSPDALPEVLKPYRGSFLQRYIKESRISSFDVFGPADKEASCSAKRYGFKRSPLFLLMQNFLQTGEEKDSTAVITAVTSKKSSIMAHPEFPMLGLLALSEIALNINASIEEKTRAGNLLSIWLQHIIAPMRLDIMHSPLFNTFLLNSYNKSRDQDLFLNRLFDLKICCATQNFHINRFEFGDEPLNRHFAELEEICNGPAPVVGIPVDFKGILIAAQALKKVLDAEDETRKASLQYLDLILSLDNLVGKAIDYANKPASYKDLQPDVERVATKTELFYQAIHPHSNMSEEQTRQATIKKIVVGTAVTALLSAVLFSGAIVALSCFDVGTGFSLLQLAIGGGTSLAIAAASTAIAIRAHHQDACVFQRAISQIEKASKEPNSSKKDDAKNVKIDI